MNLIYIFQKLLILIRNDIPHIYIFLQVQVVNNFFRDYLYELQLILYHF